jgi:hypothetical protein
VRTYCPRGKSTRLTFTTLLPSGSSAVRATRTSADILVLCCPYGRSPQPPPKPVDFIRVVLNAGESTFRVGNAFHLFASWQWELCANQRSFAAPGVEKGDQRSYLLY